MPTYISHEGIMYPAKEKVGLVNNSGGPMKHPITGDIIAEGDPYIYEGPDRAAMFELYQADKTGKTTTFGQHFGQNTDFLQMVRNLGFANKEEYLKFIGYDEKESKDKFEKFSSAINKHELPKRVAAIQVLGGGKDYGVGGKNNRYGGMGDYGEDLKK